MASEYLKWKYRDVKPREKVELTPAEKRKNWWHYHKWHLVVGVVLCAAAASLLWQVLGIGRTEPDYQIAYVGTYNLPEETVAALEGQLAALGADENGDGTVAVSLRQYPLYSEDPQTVMAAQVQLVSDLSECESYFFLLEDPERFQRDFHALRRLDGSLPEEGDNSAQETYLLWSQCPTLANLELGEFSYFMSDTDATGSSDELVSGLALGRRGFWTEKTVPYPDGCDAL